MQTLRADSISIHVVCLSVIILVVLDMMLADAATLMDLSFTIGIIYFVISAVGFMVAFFVLNRITSKRFRSLPQREQLIKIAFGTFIAISFFFLIIIIQILFTTKYQTNLLIVGSNIAYMTSCLFMVMLTHKFFAWYQSSKNLNLLLYGISTTSAAVFFIIVSIYYSAAIYLLPDIRNPAVDASLQFFDQFSYLGKLQYLAAVAAFVPPILFWESTFVMLRYYTRMIGKWKFYVILTIPIVVIITQPTVVAPLIYSSSTSQELPVYVIILGDMLPGIVGGVIFGLPYLVVRRYLSNSGTLKEAVLITAYGFIIWMLSIHMSVENAPFPPFGFVTVIAVCLSSYLILFGLSVSAKIISRNSSLRQNIRKAASYDLKFLKDIGSADMELQIEKVVRSLESKVDPYLEDVPGKILSDDEVKAYIQEIMEDLQESTKYKK